MRLDRQSCRISPSASRTFRIASLFPSSAGSRSGSSTANSSVHLRFSEGTSLKISVTSGPFTKSGAQKPRYYVGLEPMARGEQIRAGRELFDRLDWGNSKLNKDYRI